MGLEVSFLKSIRRIEPRNFTVGLLLGCFIVAFAYFSMTKHFSAVNSASTENVATPSGDMLKKMASLDQLDTGTRPKPKKGNKKQVPLCDLSQSRIDKCEIEGDVRIIGRNGTIVWVPSSEPDDGPDYERKVWHIKPYPRKKDKAAMDQVRMITVKPMDLKEAPACTNYSDVPVIVFSDSGYTIIPLALWF